jgi:hypothetical protein
MKRCEICFNPDGPLFEIRSGEGVHVFDRIECAIRGLVPPCPRCGGHSLRPGAWKNGVSYCCALCIGEEKTAPARGGPGPA